MANPIVHLTRLASAYAENTQSPIPTKTIIDGNLRPITAKQLKEFKTLLAFPQSLENAKALHQRKIQKAAGAVAHANNLKPQIDWSSGRVRLDSMSIHE